MYNSCQHSGPPERNWILSEERFLNKLQSLSSRAKGGEWNRLHWWEHINLLLQSLFQCVCSMTWRSASCIQAITAKQASCYHSLKQLVPSWKGKMMTTYESNNEEKKLFLNFTVCSLMDFCILYMGCMVWLLRKPRMFLIYVPHFSDKQGMAFPLTKVIELAWLRTMWETNENLFLSIFPLW